MTRISLLNLLLGALWLVPHAPAFCAEPEAKEPATGSVRGRILFDGTFQQYKLLKPDVLKKAGRIDKKNMGLGDVFVYLTSVPKGFEVAVPEKQVLSLTIQNQQFVPHCFLIRSGQELDVVNKDQRPANVNIKTVLNVGANVLIHPEGDVKLNEKIFRRSERNPIKISSDFSPRMSAYCLILDHPFAAISATDGTFDLAGLPAGEHEFRIWHERAGFLDQKLEVKITADKTTELEPLRFSHERFNFE